MKKIIAIVSILLGIGIFLGVFYEKLEKDSKVIKEIEFKSSELEKNPEKKVEYSIYLPDEKFTKLNKIQEEFNSVQNKNEIVKMIVEKILSQLKERKMISNDIQLRNIFFRGNEIYLNLSSWQEKDEKKNLYIIYSITNSLSEVLGEIKIKFLIKGEEEKGIFKEYYEKNLNI